MVGPLTMSSYLFQPALDVYRHAFEVLQSYDNTNDVTNVRQIWIDVDTTSLLQMSFYLPPTLRNLAISFFDIVMDVSPASVIYTPLNPLYSLVDKVSKIFQKFKTVAATTQ